MSGDTLQRFGNAFQIKAIACLLKDKPFLQQVSDILDPKYFSSDSSQWLVKTAITYYNDYKNTPTLDVLKVRVDAIDTEILKITVVDTLKDVMKHIESEDLPFVKDQITAFCKNQKLKNAILDSVELLKEGRYDEIKGKVDAAMKAGIDKNIGHDYKEMVSDRFQENKRNTSETPWEVINEIMDGGLGKGELGVFVAPAGIGKSMALVNIAAHGIQQGLNVVYYTMELNENYVGSRFDSYYTGIPSQDLKYHQAEVIEAVEKLPGKLVVKYFPTKTATVLSLAAHLEKCTMQGLKPDLVLVDYADLLRDTGAKNAVRHDIMLGNIYEDLRGVAGTLQIPIWTASQANRSALEEDIIEADKISESYAKIMIADFVVSLSRKTTDKISGTGRWHVIKNRFGPDGVTFPSKMNMSICKINIYAENTIQGAEAKKVMSNHDEVIRKTLQNKFAELSGLVDL